ncbi:DUF6307 family protein [Saccharothrix violaceirubra]|uniref:Uncharacterized protein n=1 Tax=Saccharothrix violaceirubra TaxID=413306 RepID=A0A7W7T2T8_9PSEU|nr:DUF6307 family protein [Saccharothrix violaceirubra]MBB4965543.1 hypothetical protein [Saccharothrix violaceirubra]
MKTPIHLSAYERRVALVQETLSANSELTRKNARVLAVRVLDALDRIPEKVR